MARRRERDTSSSITSRQNSYVPLSRLLRPHVTFPSFGSLSRRLLDFEDRRSFHPARTNRPVVSRVGRSRIGVARSLLPDVPAAVRFVNPRNVIVCVRRKMRKEVLHALKKTGGRGGKNRRPRRNSLSNIHC